MHPKVSLQITLAPSDFAHARYLLPHQIRTWRDQVDEILLTIDFHRSKGRFSERWSDGAKKIRPLAESISDARVLDVDYSAATQAAVANEFFGGTLPPAKDFRGGPYYSYFFGLHAVQNDYVLHVDSDMFFGGGSKTWIAEAFNRLGRDPRILIAAPLSGPPALDGSLRFLKAMPDRREVHTHRFDVMSTRLFLISKAVFQSQVSALKPRPPPAWKSRVIARLEGNPVADLPEHVITDQMRQRGLYRLEFLGSQPGMWSLHPPYRGLDFYRKLPDLVRRIEAGDIPEAQRGDHDINDSMVDWTEGRTALRKNRIWRRVGRRWFHR